MARSWLTEIGYTGKAVGNESVEIFRYGSCKKGIDLLLRKTENKSVPFSCIPHHPQADAEQPIGRGLNIGFVDAHPVSSTSFGAVKG